MISGSPIASLPLTTVKVVVQGDGAQIPERARAITLIGKSAHANTGFSYPALPYGDGLVPTGTAVTLAPSGAGASWNAISHPDAPPGLSLK